LTGYIDRTGNPVIPPQFSEGTDFHEGLAAAILEKNCLIVNGGSCAPGRYTAGRNPDAPPCRWAIIDKRGQPVSGEPFDYVGEFSEGLAAVQVDKLWGYADRSGKIVIAAQWSRVEPFSEGLAMVWDGAAGYIDHSGKFVLPSQFPGAESFSRWWGMNRSVSGISGATEWRRFPENSRWRARSGSAWRM
jgi:hypothetical protein